MKWSNRKHGLLYFIIAGFMMGYGTMDMLRAYPVGYALVFGGVVSAILGAFIIVEPDREYDDKNDSRRDA